MSKFTKILIALVAITMMAAPAFAITADFTGFLQTRGIAYDNMDGDDDIDDNARGVDSRYRLWTNTALNENVKAVFAIEVDYFWGGPNDLGDIGADAKSTIEIKQVYLDFNVPTANMNFKVGTQYTVLGKGLILAGDDTTGVTARWTPAKGQSLAFYWVKTIEGDTTGPGAGKFDDSADQDYYHLQYDMDINGMRLSPFVGYYDLADDDEAYFLGAEFGGKLGPVALSAAAVFNDWEQGADDGNGISALVNAKFKAGMADLIAEVGYMGDDDRADGAFFAVRHYHQFSEIITGGRFDGRGTIGSNQTVTASATGAPYDPNYMYVKLGAEAKVAEGTKISAYYIYAEEAEDSATRDAITYGHEVDVYLDQEVVKGLTFTVGGGYLLADDDFGDDQATAANEGGDDAWKVGTALTYTF